MDRGREARGRVLMQALADRGAVIEFGPHVGRDVDVYAEPGMRARLKGFRFHEVYECEVATFDFSEFEEHNRPLEKAGWYDKDGNPTLTAREAGFYKPQDTMYVNLDDIGNIVRPLPSATSLLIACYQDDDGGFASYGAWLEHHAARALGLDPEPAAPDQAAAPSLR